MAKLSDLLEKAQEKKTLIVVGFLQKDTYFQGHVVGVHDDCFELVTKVADGNDQKNLTFIIPFTSLMHIRLVEKKANES